MGNKKSKESELREFRHFGRILKYVRPHKRYLFIAIACMVGVALCFTVSIVSVYPILKVLVGKETLHDFVDRAVLQQRLDCELAISDTDNLTLAYTLSPKTLQVVRPGDSSDLQELKVRTGDYIVALDDQDYPGQELLRTLVRTEGAQQISLGILPATGGQVRTVTVRLKPTKMHLKLARKIISYVPAEQPRASDAQRMRWRLTILVYILAAVFLLQIIGNICRFLGEYYGSVVGSRVLLDIRRHMYAKTLALPMSFYVTRGIADTMSRFMRDTYDILRALRTLFGKVLREPLKICLVFGAALYIEYHLTLMILVVAPVAAWLLRKFGRRIRKANQKMLEAYGRLLSSLESTLNGISVVKAYTMESRERLRYFRVERKILKQQLRIDMVNAMSSPILEILAIFAVCVFLRWCTKEVMAGRLEPERLGVLLFAMAAMFNSLRKIANVYNQFQRANAGAKRVFELIDTPTEAQIYHGIIQAHPPTKGISFENVTFSYPNNDRPVLCDINLQAKPDQITAIVGPNGSGKTTLVYLLLRFFDPQEGRILWDGMDLRELDVRSLRKHIALVSQQTVIFPDTIKANIAYGNQAANIDQITAAARRAHAHEFISQLPQGYDTLVGEQGTRLSGGEAQRLAIARAVLRDAPVLIFDEATSQIDAESEKNIQQAMNDLMPGKTAFIIAHRFSTIAKADIIVVMDHGRIVAADTHKKLIKASPLYNTLYQTQFEALRPDNHDK